MSLASSQYVDGTMIYRYIKILERQVFTEKNERNVDQL